MRPVLASLLLLTALLLAAACGQYGIICSKNEVRCGRSCANFQVDPAHCGNCDTACATGFVCQSGACVCPTGLNACSQRCADFQTDTGNCGGCGQTCAAGQSCLSGVCSTPSAP